MSQVLTYLDRANLVFQLVFAAELAANLYAHWFWLFARDLWLVFDFVVVSLSLIGLAPMHLPLKLILLCRCARVVRLFRRIDSIKSILTAIACSLLPISGAFLIIFVLSSICQAPKSLSVASRMNGLSCFVPSLFFLLPLSAPRPQSR